MPEETPPPEDKKSPQPDKTPTEYPVQQYNLEDIGKKLKIKDSEISAFMQTLRRWHAKPPKYNVQTFDLQALADTLERHGYHEQAAELRKRLEERSTD